MSFIEQLKLIKRLDNLIQRKATGTPQQLADRLDISRSSVFRQISILKKLGAKIYYCKHSRSYRYEEKFSDTFLASLD